MLSWSRVQKNGGFANDEWRLARLKNSERAASENVQMPGGLRNVIIGSSTELTGEKHSGRKRKVREKRRESVHLDTPEQLLDTLSDIQYKKGPHHRLVSCSTMLHWRKP